VEDMKRYVKGSEVIAEIEKRERGYYIIFAPNTCPCTCGVFNTLKEAMDTVKRLRPLAEICE